MEILNQSRPRTSSRYSYVLYTLISNGDLIHIHSWSNYWDALDSFKNHQRFNKSLKFVLVGSECDPLS